MNNALLFNPEQEVLVAGKTLKLPDSLYIPPDALRIVLEQFSGPLDLLLYLIRHQNIDILDVPIAKITEQYMLYVEMMRLINLELASEYLLMAAILGEIKSRMLLPQSPGDEESDEDPRAELIRRLQEYEIFKKAADSLDKLPRLNRDAFVAHAKLQSPKPQVLIDVQLAELMFAFGEVYRRNELFTHHNITAEPLSIRERMTNILETIKQNKTAQFSNLFSISEGKNGAVITFLAILELVKEQLIAIIQNNHYGEIYLQTNKI